MAKDRLPVFAGKSFVIIMLILASADRIAEGRLRAAQPLTAEPHRFHSARHENVSVHATDKKREEVAHHPVIPKHVVQAVRPLL